MCIVLEEESVWPNISHILTLCHCQFLWCQMECGRNKSSMEDWNDLTNTRRKESCAYKNYIYIYICISSMLIKNIFNQKVHKKMFKTGHGNWHNVSMACLMKLFLSVNLIWAHFLDIWYLLTTNFLLQCLYNETVV